MRTGAGPLLHPSPHYHRGPHPLPPRAPKPQEGMAHEARAHQGKLSSQKIFLKDAIYKKKTVLKNSILFAINCNFLYTFNTLITTF